MPARDRITHFYYSPPDPRADQARGCCCWRELGAPMIPCPEHEAGEKAQTAYLAINRSGRCR